MVKGINAEYMRRKNPVTLAEMTRRRDSWRAKHDQLARKIKAAELRVSAASRNATAQLLRAFRAEQDAITLVERLSAALAEARSHALECGQLRDDLTRLKAESNAKIKAWSESCDELRAEVERLRAARREDHATFATQHKDIEREIREARAELEGKAALEREITRLTEDLEHYKTECSRLRMGDDW
jgi:chromosome segregation ATPase